MRVRFDPRQSRCARALPRRQQLPLAARCHARGPDDTMPLRPRHHAAGTAARRRHAGSGRHIEPRRGGPCHLYPEWDYRCGVLRPDWCTAARSCAAGPAGASAAPPPAHRPCCRCTAHRAASRPAPAPPVGRRRRSTWTPPSRCLVERRLRAGTRRPHLSAPRPAGAAAAACWCCWTCRHPPVSMRRGRSAVAAGSRAAGRPAAGALRAGRRQTASPSTASASDTRAAGAVTTACSTSATALDAQRPRTPGLRRRAPPGPPASARPCAMPRAAGRRARRTARPAGASPTAHRPTWTCSTPAT